MRNAFIDELVLQARKNKNIALVVGDLGYKVIEPFAEEFPDRFINAGVAEQNMTGLAAGMASEGFHVFTYSIANFPTFRCAEQIRNDVDYHNLPVTIVTVGGGLSYGNLGYSHHAIQDYALIRTMPNMLISAPGDPLEVRASLKYLVNNPQPSYLRIGKAGEATFHTKLPELSPYNWVLVKQGTGSNCFLTTGATLKYAIEWSKDSRYENYSIYTLPLWGMKGKENQIQFLSKFNHIITVEDHLYDGGFGSWLLESTSNMKGIKDKIEIKALNSFVCGAVGSQDYLNKLGGLTI